MNKKYIFVGMTCFQTFKINFFTALVNVAAKIGKFANAKAIKEIRKQISLCDAYMGYMEVDDLEEYKKIKQQIKEMEL